MQSCSERDGRRRASINELVEAEQDLWWRLDCGLHEGRICAWDGDASDADSWKRWSDHIGHELGLDRLYRDPERGSAYRAVLKHKWKGPGKLALEVQGQRVSRGAGREHKSWSEELATRGQAPRAALVAPQDWWQRLEDRGRPGAETEEEEKEKAEEQQLHLALIRPVRPGIWNNAAEQKEKEEAKNKEKERKRKKETEQGQKEKETEEDKREEEVAEEEKETQKETEKEKEEERKREKKKEQFLARMALLWEANHGRKRKREPEQDQGFEICQIPSVTKSFIICTQLFLRFGRFHSVQNHLFLR